MKIDTVFLDMDGVVADFVQGVLDLLHDGELPLHWPKGEYSLAARLQITRTQMAAAIDEAGPEWWVNLQRFRWAFPLFEACDAAADEVVFVSAPLDFQHACAGKAQWMEKHFLGGIPELILTNRKDLLARPRTVLIDDCEENVRAFQSHAGAAAILFPQVWNGAPECVNGKRVSPDYLVVHRLMKLLEV